MASYAASMPSHPTFVSDTTIGQSKTGVLSVSSASHSDRGEIQYFVRDVAALQAFHLNRLSLGYDVFYWTAWSADVKTWNHLHRYNTNDKIKQSIEVSETEQYSIMRCEQEQTPVRFDYVSIREFEVIPCDGPYVLEGVGIELGWKYNILLDQKPIDEYEGERRKVRRKNYFHTPPSPLIRMTILREAGFTKKQLDEASKNSARLRKEHEKSLARMKYDRFYELTDGISVPFKGFPKRGFKKKIF